MEFQVVTNIKRVHSLFFYVSPIRFHHISSKVEPIDQINDAVSTLIIEPLFSAIDL